MCFKKKFSFLFKNLKKKIRFIFIYLFIFVEKKKNFDKMKKMNFDEKYIYFFK